MRQGKTWAAIALAVLVSACGGSPTGSSNKYPPMNGTYSFTATFDAFTSTSANASGTISFVQSGDVGTLSGSANVLINLAGSASTPTNIMTNASVTADGRVSFRLGSNPTNPWQFDGTVSADGRSMSGTHTLGVGSSTPFPGRWSASR
jgi:hypothetical protein